MMLIGRIIMFVFVLIAFTVWPLVLQRSPAVAILLALAIVAWIVWSVTTYLRWARGLGGPKAGQPRRSRERSKPEQCVE